MRVMVLDSVGLHEYQIFELSTLSTGDEFSIPNHFVRGDSMIHHHILRAKAFHDPLDFVASMLEAAAAKLRYLLQCPIQTRMRLRTRLHQPSEFCAQNARCYDVAK